MTMRTCGAPTLTTVVGVGSDSSVVTYMKSDQEPAYLLSRVICGESATTIWVLRRSGRTRHLSKEPT